MPRLRRTDKKVGRRQPIYNPGLPDMYQGTANTSLNLWTTGWIRVRDNSSNLRLIRQAYTSDPDPNKVGWMDNVTAFTISMTTRFNAFSTTLPMPGKDDAVTFLKASAALSSVPNSQNNKASIEWKVYADTTAGLIHIWNPDANWDWLYGGARQFRLHHTCYADQTNPNLVHNKFWITADDPANTTLFGEYNTYGKVGDTMMAFGFDSTYFQSTYFYDYLGYAFEAYDPYGNIVPEPSSFAALGASLIGALGLARRRRG